MAGLSTNAAKSEAIGLISILTRIVLGVHPQKLGLVTKRLLYVNRYDFHLSFYLHKSVGLLLARRQQRLGGAFHRLSDRVDLEPRVDCRGRRRLMA